MEIKTPRVFGYNYHLKSSEGGFVAVSIYEIESSWEVFNGSILPVLPIPFEVNEVAKGLFGGARSWFAWAPIRDDCQYHLFHQKCACFGFI